MANKYKRCSSCYCDVFNRSKSSKTIHCAACNQTFPDVVFQAHGDEAVTAQIHIVTEHIRASARVRIAQNIVAALFVVMAGSCVLFAPSGREVTSEIIGAAFLIFGAGIAGFANLRFRTRYLEIHASEQPRSIRRENAKADLPSDKQSLRKFWF